MYIDSSYECRIQSEPKVWQSLGFQTLSLYVSAENMRFCAKILANFPEVEVLHRRSIDFNVNPNLTGVRNTIHNSLLYTVSQWTQLTVGLFLCLKLEMKFQFRTDMRAQNEIISI